MAQFGVNDIDMEGVKEIANSLRIAGLQTLLRIRKLSNTK